MSLLPSRLRVTSSPGEPKVLDIEGEDADAAFDALGSDTAREVLATVYEEPRTPPEIRETVGTSLQNVHYHLDRLESADLIEPAGMGYSAKGNEMTVYGPASEAVVIFAGEETDGSRLREHLGRLLGLFVLVGLSTVVFALVHGWLTGPPEPRAESLEAADAPAAADGAATAVTALDPTVAFFLGGCAIVAAIGLWWALRPRLRSLWRSR